MAASEWAKRKAWELIDRFDLDAREDCEPNGPVHLALAALLDEARAKGRAEERREVVAWLYAKADASRGFVNRSANEEHHAFYWGVAIARGDHAKGEPK